MLRFAFPFVGIGVGLAVILGFALTLWKARRSGVLTGGDLPRGVRIERSFGSARFDRHLGDRVRLMILPFSFAVGAILIGALALWIALTSDGS